MLTVIRGLPGSGKSTLAKSLGCVHLEADMYFIKDGKYSFDASRVKLAHEWCQAQVQAELALGNSVVVSNTFVKRWEFQPYLEMGKRHNHEVKIIIAKGNYGNVHGVPEAVVERMRATWQE